MRKNLHTILILLVHCYIYIVYAKLHNLVYHKCRNETTLTEMKHGKSLIDCIKSCNARATCKSFVYHVQLHMCAYYDNEDESGVIDCDLQVWYGNISDYTSTKTSGCENQNCADGSECVNDSGHVVCKILECQRTILAQQVRLLGNLDGVGHRRRGIDEVGKTTYLEICTGVGQWEQVTGSSQSLPPDVGINILFMQVNSSPMQMQAQALLWTEQEPNCL